MIPKPLKKVYYITTDENKFIVGKCYYQSFSHGVPVGVPVKTSIMDALVHQKLNPESVVFELELDDYTFFNQEIVVMHIFRVTDKITVFHEKPPVLLENATAKQLIEQLVKVIG